MNNNGKNQEEKLAIRGKSRMCVGVSKDTGKNKSHMVY